MISPHTPPGTYIVCIDDIANGQYNKSSVKNLDGLKKGSVYTVKNIEPYDNTLSGFIVVLNEIRRRVKEVDGYDIARFKKLELPKSITSLLTNIPVTVD